MARGLRRRRLAALALALALGPLVAAGAACSDDDPDTPAATLGTQRTTTSAELSVEEEVEAAYLRSWDVYAEAMRSLDPSRLAEVYVDAALSVRLTEVSELAEAGTPARMSVEHNIGPIHVEGDVALLRDDYINHSVLLNPDGTPAEPDPAERLSYEYTLKRTEDTWKVALVSPVR